MVLASHTHFAPSLDESKPALGTVDPTYFSFVIERCRDLIDRVMSEKSRAALLKRHLGTSDAAINRRRPWRLPHLYGRRFAGLQDVMAPNPRGQLDPTITAVSIVDETDRPFALVWHFACHPTGFPNQSQVSSDFPGTVRALLRSRYGDVPVLFLQGFAGDIRPRVPETRPPIRRALKCLVWGPTFGSFGLEEWRRWSAMLADEVLRALEREPTAIDSAEIGIRSLSRTVPIAKLMTGKQPDRTIRFQRLQVTSLIDIVAVAAEPLTGLRALIPFEGALAVGYLGDVFGYWPTDRDAVRGGYEVNHFLAPFGLKGQLRNPLDPVFTHMVSELHNPQ